MRVLRRGIRISLQTFIGYVPGQSLDQRLTHLPVIVDPSHAAGDRELVIPLALTPEDVVRLVAGLKPIVAARGRVW